MYLSVQRAARRLGVSSHTVRRWTDSGFLPCIRTAGGHRRISSEDLDELAALAGGGDHVAARLAREREVETLVEASIALTSRLEPAELLGEIARRMTAVLDCHFCAISAYDAETDMVRVLADFDRNGERFADWPPYSLKEFPFSKGLMEAQELAVIRVSDPGADPAETAVMRHWSEKTLLLVPLVYAGRSVGLLEVYDHLRERRFTRQELRLARALASLAAVALRNAVTFARLTSSDSEARSLQAALDVVIEGLPGLAALGTADDVLQATAALACRALRGVAAVAAWGSERAEASGPPAERVNNESADRRDPANDHVVSAEAASRDEPLSLSVTLPNAGDDGQRRVLRLIAAGAAAALGALTAAPR